MLTSEELTTIFDRLADDAAQLNLCWMEYTGPVNKQPPRWRALGYAIGKLASALVGLREAIKHWEEDNPSCQE